jgi:hypothetical protein
MHSVPGQWHRAGPGNEGCEGRLFNFNIGMAPTPARALMPAWVAAGGGPAPAAEGSLRREAVGFVAVRLAATSLATA